MALQILTANIFAESLFNMPSLFEHYQEHKQHETPGITFFDFMVMHYLDAEHEDSDRDHHSKLPLKDLACHAQGIDYSLPAGFTLDCNTSAGFIIISKASCLYSFYLPSAYIAGVFQPPRA